MDLVIKIFLLLAICIINIVLGDATLMTTEVRNNMMVFSMLSIIAILLSMINYDRKNNHLF